MVAGAKDITDIKRIEAEIRRERNFSKNIIATVPDSLLVINKDLKIKNANRTFYKMFRTEPDKAIGYSITDILGDKDGKLSTALLNLFGTDDILDGLELQYQSKRLGKRILNIIARTIIFEEEEEKEIIVLQDITKRKQAEEMLRRFNEELELKVKERTEELDKKMKEIEEQRVVTLNFANDLEGTNVNLLNEIAERKQAEDELKESEESYRGLFNSATEAIYIKDKDGFFVDVNEGAIEMYGYPREFFIGKTQEFLSAPGKNDMKKVLKMVQKAFMGEPQRFEFYGLRKNGEVFPKDLQLNSGTYFGEKVVIAFARDITEQKKAENLQKVLYNISIAVNTTESIDELYKTIRGNLGTVIDTTNFYVALYDEENDTLSLPFDVDEKDHFETFPAGKSLSAYVIKTGKPLLVNDKVFEKLVNSGEVEEVATPSKIWMGSPLKVGNKKTGIIVVQSYTDPDLYSEKDLEILEFASYEIAIAIEHKQVEEQIIKSLKEKEVLLMEVHHRVKNNMQVISSLLKLQSRYIENKETLELFRVSQNRIRSMALIHQKLYQTRDFAKIDLSEYVKSLSVSLISSFNVSPKKIKLNIDIKDVWLNINSAIPCGLIINELLSNSLKHAFPEGREGEISVIMTKNDKKYTLVVKDNGVGMPDNFDMEKEETLGLMLVSSLTQQLHGSFENSVDKGTTFKIDFVQI